MSALFSFVGKKILAESARNHFGSEVNLPRHCFVCIVTNRICFLGSLLRRSPGIAIRPSIWQENAEKTQGDSARSL